MNSRSADAAQPWDLAHPPAWIVTRTIAPAQLRQSILYGSRMMPSPKLILCLLVLVTASGCNRDLREPPARELLLTDAQYLDRTRTLLAVEDPHVLPAFKELVKEADQALAEGPFSVMQKEAMPPSGDRHDYVSYSRYWWPDSTKSDGLPYIRRDGITNPESQSPRASDRSRIGALGRNCETLALAYALTGEGKYADKVADLLRTWFLEDETRMNPNLNHAQCRPGHNDGSKSGVLDGRVLIRALEALPADREVVRPKGC